jgi:hypothetical protein
MTSSGNGGPWRWIRYTQGSPIFKDVVATTDSVMVQRLRNALLKS